MKRKADPAPLATALKLAAREKRAKRKGIDLAKAERARLDPEPDKKLAAFWNMLIAASLQQMGGS